MIRALTVLALVSCAAAFVSPAMRSVARKSFNLEMAFANGYPGADGPEPFSKNFDPLGLSEKSPELVSFFRESELKHGRICMLASPGFIVAGFVRLPGEIYQAGSVVEAHNNMIAKGPMWQVLFWTSFIELITLSTVYKMNEKDRAPGDFSFDPLGLGKDPEKKARYAISELKNGRLAMLAFSGMVTQAVLTGHEFPYLY